MILSRALDLFFVPETYNYSCLNQIQLGSGVTSPTRQDISVAAPSVTINGSYSSDGYQMDAVHNMNFQCGLGITGTYTEFGIGEGFAIKAKFDTPLVLKETDIVFLKYKFRHKALNKGNHNFMLGSTTLTSQIFYDGYYGNPARFSSQYKNGDGSINYQVHEAYIKFEIRTTDNVDRYMQVNIPRSDISLVSSSETNKTYKVKCRVKNDDPTKGFTLIDNRFFLKFGALSDIRFTFFALPPEYFLVPGQGIEFDAMVSISIVPKT